MNLRQLIIISNENCSMQLKWVIFQLQRVKVIKICFFKPDENHWMSTEEVVRQQIYRLGNYMGRQFLKAFSLIVSQQCHFSMLEYHIEWTYRKIERVYINCNVYLLKEQAYTLYHSRHVCTFEIIELQLFYSGCGEHFITQWML